MRPLKHVKKPKFGPILSSNIDIKYVKGYITKVYLPIEPVVSVSGIWIRIIAAEIVAGLCVLQAKDGSLVIGHRSHFFSIGETYVVVAQVRMHVINSYMYEVGDVN